MVFFMPLLHAIGTLGFQPRVSQTLPNAHFQAVPNKCAHLLGIITTTMHTHKHTHAQTHTNAEVEKALEQVTPE